MMVTGSIINLDQDDQHSHNEDNDENDNENENVRSIVRSRRTRIRNELKMLIRKEDWSGIVQMLHRCQHKSHDEDTDTMKNNRSSISTSEEKKDNVVPRLQQSSPKSIQGEVDLSLDLNLDVGIDEEDETFTDYVVAIQEELVSIVSASNNVVQLRLIKKKDDEGAQDLLIILCTLGGKSIVTTSNSSISAQEKNSSTNRWNTVTFYQGGYRYKGSLIHAALKYHVRPDVIIKFIELGGREAVLEVDDDGRNSLQVACCSNTSVHVVSKIIDVGGGRDFVLQKNSNCGWTALHYACQNEASLELVSKLIEVGGEKLVLARDRIGKYGWTALRFSCCYNSSVGVVSKLIEVGGTDAVLEKNEDGWNLLHFACRHRAAVAVVSKLIEVGGKKLLMDTAYNGDNVLHCAVNQLSPNTDTIELLIEHGGKDILMQQTKTTIGEETPLHFLLTKNTRYYEQGQKRKIVEKASILINHGNALKIGGEFAIGGLFKSSSNEEVIEQVYNNWDELGLPALEQVMALPQNRHLPILHAVIINEAPLHIMKTILNRFLGSINSLDSLDRLPIDVGVQHNLAWDKGMKEIVETLSSVQQVPPIIVCSRHGLQWENGMKNVLEDSIIEDIERKDESTGLYPFMLAAIGGRYNYDISLIFQLILASPRLIQRHKHCDAEALRKRKRMSENN